MASRKFLLNLKNVQINARNLTIRTSTLRSSSSDASKKAELSEVTHTGQVNSLQLVFSGVMIVLRKRCFCNIVQPHEN